MKILAADIGGTYSRFGVFECNEFGELSIQQHVTLITNAYKSFSDLVRQIILSDLKTHLTTGLVTAIAVPGPVFKGKARILPNVTWTVDVEEVGSYFSNSQVDSVHLINDFVAQAFACRTPAMANALCIQRGATNPTGVVSVIGAGTGLGHCSLVSGSKMGFVPLPSEAGHQPFTFEGGEERRFETFLRKVYGQTPIDGNIVVSGCGLSLLHKFISGEDISAAQVSALLTADSKLTYWFARFYGRVARNYTLSVLSTGGLYITGGIAKKNRFLVDHVAFRQEFSANPSHHELLKNIPIYLVTNELSGLWGAAYFATCSLSNDTLTSSYPRERQSFE